MELVVGRVGRPHGVRGEVTVELRTDDPERRFATGAQLTSDRGVRLTVGAARHAGRRTVVAFVGVTDRSAAERLRGSLLTVDVDERERPDDPDEYYDHQIVGCAVTTADGERVGEVTEVLHLPGQDQLAVRRPDGSEALIPFVAAIVPTVDVSGRRVVVDPPSGLLGGGDEPGPAG